MTTDERGAKKVAFAFAALLVVEDFEKAYELLSSSARVKCSSDSLEKEYRDMTAYFNGAPVETVAIGLFNDDTKQWWDSQPTDIAQVYVAIEPGGDSEAVFVTVCKEQGDYRIRHIEWRRP